MKRKINLILISSALTLGLSSCLFQDDLPGSELTTSSKEGSSVVYVGKADTINYKHPAKTQAGLQSALAEMEKIALLGQLNTAQFAMRGGKDGNIPGPHQYQFQFSLEIDNYAGYMCLPQRFGGRMPSTYYNFDNFNGGAAGSFISIKNSIVPILNHPQIDSIPEIKAFALLIYSYSSQEMTDIYGPFPYADYKANKQTAPFTYNSVESIYKTIVNNLDTIVACIDHFESQPSWYQEAVKGILQTNDLITSFENRDIKNWKKLANSLKLRMAMHIVKIDSKLAKKWAEEAVQSGVIDSNEAQAKLDPLTFGFSHPLATISNIWNDTRLNASLESIMKSLNHPYLAFIFDKNTDRIYNKNDDNKFLEKESKIVGLRSGILMLEGQNYEANFRVAYSRVNELNISTTPLYIMKYAEVLFLRAEGALRGWNMGGSAQSFYEQGIKDAFVGEAFNDIYQNVQQQYMAQDKATDFTYEDPWNPRYNRPSLTKIGVKWNEGEDKETKLEKIITQKYIANFPYSFEAWTDLRRTGYPKIFPVLRDEGDGSIAAGDIIRRIPFPGTGQPSVQADVDKTGIPALGGPDKQGTRLWWDAAVGNF